MQRPGRVSAGWPVAFVLAVCALLLQLAVPVVHQAQIGPDARPALGPGDIWSPTGAAPLWRAEHRGSATHHDADACPVCRALLHSAGLSPASQPAIMQAPGSRGLLADAWQPGRTGSRSCGEPRAPPALV